MIKYNTHTRSFSLREEVGEVLYAANTIKNFIKNNLKKFKYPKQDSSVPHIKELNDIIEKYGPECISDWISKFIDDSGVSFSKSFSDDDDLGHCYEIAYRYFDRNCHKNPNLRLVHGLVTGQGPIKGIIYNHAWVEDVKANIVYDMTMPEGFQVVPQGLYYEIGKVQQTYKYDFKEKAKKAAEYKTYGPWEDDLLNNPY